MTLSQWFEALDTGGGNAGSFAALRKARVIFDPEDAGEVADLRADGARIARNMEDPGRPPPMLWSGIPLPAARSSLSCDYHAVISVGGTKTDFAMLRLDRGEPRAFDFAAGREIANPERIEGARIRVRTPVHGRETRDGGEMIPLIVGGIAAAIRRDDATRRAFDRCQGALLSWGFAHDIARTGPRLLGGFEGRVISMSKGQQGFAGDLQGKDVVRLFDEQFRRHFGASWPIAIANDTVMALSYFLGPAWRSRHRSIGLFINGTGSNFAMAEPYAVPASGYIRSADGSDRSPRLLPPGGAPEAGERLEEFLVNFETGSIELQLTRTRFDLEDENPIERNALSGVRAFSQQLEGFTRELLSGGLYGKLRGSWTAAGKGQERTDPGAPEIGLLAACNGGAREVGAIFGGLPLDGREAAGLRLFARAMVNRSAMHAALILYAVMLRRGYGRGGDGKPDLVGMEGSLWKMPGYRELVRGWWQALAGPEPLRVEFGSEPGFNASLPGPLYLAALQE